MTTRSGTFTAAGETSLTFFLRATETARVVLTITGSATITLDEIVGSTVVRTRETFTASTTGFDYVNTTPTAKVLQLRAQAVSGSVAYSLADVVGDQVLEEWRAADGTLVAMVTDLGVFGVSGAGRDVTSPIYGARGDGVTEDSTAIQAALDAANAAGGGRVFLPKGTYKVTTGLSLYDNVEVCGAGMGLTTISGTLATSTTSKFSAASKSNVWLHDLSITGTHAWGIFLSGGTGNRVERCAVSGGTTVDSSGSKGGGIYAENATGIIIAANVLSGNGGTDVDDFWDILFNFGTYAVTDSQIVGNQCSSDVFVNIGAFDSRRLLIQGNLCTGASTPSGTPTTGGYGIMVYKTAPFSAANCGEHVIANNIVRSVGGTGIYVQTMRDTAVMGNVVISSCSEQNDTSLGVAGIDITDSPNCAVTGNRIKTSGQSGIGITGTSHYTTVTGNNISDCTKLGIAIRGTVTDVVVSGNTVYNCAQDGIGSWSDLAAARISITGNKVRTITSGSYRGIYAAPNATAWVITGNSISDTAGAGVVATASDHTIDDATWSGSATFDPANLVDGDGTTTNVTVTGAALGDKATASFSLDLQSVTMTAYVSAANTVTVRMQNESGSAKDLASGTLRARVRRN